MSRLWGGRFSREPSALMQQFNDSISFDVRLWDADIRGSIAYARALARAGLLTRREVSTLVRGLKQIHAEFAQGTFTVKPGDEDIHTAVERRLRELVGEVAGKLHTGRSRNDQVATEVRMSLRERTTDLARALLGLCHQLMQLAEQHKETLMPGLTHQQHAQPVTLGHHLMAHCWAFIRDLSRLAHAGDRMNLCPLGAGALSGTTFPIDRELLAAELGFGMPIPNSMDAVSDRDFIAEYLFVSALLMVHLSRLAQELILWSTPEYGYVELADAHTTGSSMMPQKKNPDIAELIRGRSALVIGNLTGILALIKGLPLAYNRDLQEDKVPLFESADALISTLRLFAAMLSRLQFRIDVLEKAAQDPALLATDLADRLVKRGMPFRQAHQAVKELFSYLREAGKDLSHLTLDEMRRFCPFFKEEDLALDPWTAVKDRDHPGGTSPQRVREQIALARHLLKEGP